MKKFFLTLTKITISIGVLLGGLYLAANLWLWNERDKTRLAVEEASERYALANPEVSQEELDALAQDLFMKELARKNLLVDGK